ncbi:MAG: AI-2E family transporter [Elusimicrobiota bacterium]|jgi:predicted PurR-regulated permease PerM|nr:AI-2E family transporter [Elusimicrobiota bacterium]
MMNESAKTRIFIVAILFFLALCLFLYFARNILTPFLLAAFITYLLSPLVLRIQAAGFRRWVAVLAIALFVLIALTVLLLFLVPMLIREFSKLNIDFPYYYNFVYSHFEIIKSKLEEVAPIIQEQHIFDAAIAKIQSIVFAQTQKIPSYLVSFFGAFSMFILVPMLVFFMLIGGNKMFDTIVELVPSSSVETILSMLYEMDSSLGKYIRGQLIEASFVGIMSIIVLSIWNVNFALLIGVSAGFANLIPYVGPSFGLIFASIVALVQYQDIFVLVKIIPSFLIIQFLDNNLIQPLVVGRNVNLGPVSMIFAMLAAAQVFGFLGIFFAVPAAAIIKTIFLMLLQKYKKAVFY